MKAANAPKLPEPEYKNQFCKRHQLQLPTRHFNETKIRFSGTFCLLLGSTLGLNGGIYTNYRFKEHTPEILTHKQRILRYNISPDSWYQATITLSEDFNSLPYLSQKKRMHSGATSIAFSSYIPVSGLSQTNA